MPFLKSAMLPIFTGFAIFSMFFGSGNIVFPLYVGASSGEYAIWGILGFLITGVLVPFSGVMAVLFFKGNHELFLGRVGRSASFFITTCLMVLIGPFAVIPRCVTLSHATFKAISPDTTLFSFALYSVLLIFILSYKKRLVMDVLGKILTPVLLGSLILLVVKGIFFSPHVNSFQVSFVPDFPTFWKGLVTGYQTMDLIASFYFSSFVYYSLKLKVGEGKAMVSKALASSLIGGGFLAFIYMSLSFLANVNASNLQGVEQEALLGELSLLVLGEGAGYLANVVASLAALTTAISLMTVFVSFVHKDIFRESINEKVILVFSSVIALIFSNFNFSGIMSVLGPVVEVFYPAIIILTLCNLCHYFWGLRWIKFPFYATLLVSLVIKISSLLS